MLKTQFDPLNFKILSNFKTFRPPAVYKDGGQRSRQAPRWQKLNIQCVRVCAAPEPESGERAAACSQVHTLTQHTHTHTSVY